MASRDEILADLVVDTMVWLELVDDETLHPDTAVGLLEGYAASFEQLGAGDRLWLYERMRDRERREARPQAKEALAAFAEGLLDG